MVRFSNEYWLNLNNNRGQRDFILRQLAARTRKCANAGFDAVEYDNVETYAQPTRVTGWHVSAHTQLIFNTALAKMAHANGLSVALKNDLGQVPRLEPHFDFAVNEQCCRLRAGAERTVQRRGGAHMWAAGRVDTGGPTNRVRPGRDESEGRSHERRIVHWRIP